MWENTHLDPSAVRVALHVGGLRAGSGGLGKTLGHGHGLRNTKGRKKGGNDGKEREGEMEEEDKGKVRSPKKQNKNKPLKMLKKSK